MDGPLRIVWRPMRSRAGNGVSLSPTVPVPNHMLRFSACLSPAARCNGPKKASPKAGQESRFAGGGTTNWERFHCIGARRSNTPERRVIRARFALDLLGSAPRQRCDALSAMGEFMVARRHERANE